MSDPLFVDVYHYDVGGKPSWKALVDAGPPWHGAVVKVSEGLGGVEPWQRPLAAWFAAQWSAIRAEAGERYGVDFFRGGYHYLLVGANPVQQADHYLRRIDAAGGWGAGDLWPIVDVEEGSGNSGKSKQQVIDTTTMFVERVRAETGRQVVLYAGWWVASLGITNKMGCSYIWYPSYTATLPARQTYRRIGWTLPELFAWQYAGDGIGKLAGYPMTSPIGKVDLNAITIAGGGAKALSWLRQHLWPDPARRSQPESPDEPGLVA